MSTPSSLPNVPVKHADFITHVASNPDTSLAELLEPYKQYDAKLREVFAQEPTHPALDDPYLNIVPVFNGKEEHVKVRARNLDSESDEEKERYVMALKQSARLPNGSNAIVQNLKEFQQNFSLFCESSLVDMDWSNVVAAGSSVVTCMLPVPEKYKASKRALRQYYHETIAPASDIDLFIYGLSEEAATNKIIEIEQRIKDSILVETTTIRTKNAITIASQYPTRHIQIVLRIYKSVAEILTGFDVDCSCAAYDGKQVYAAPRALTAYMSQVNTIDLTRRSPSYENRLSKYSHRGFEVYWPLLERSRVDPTIFERNFGRTVGLARLLVLERLPSKSERESYMDERREERGRPAINRGWDRSTGDNIKDRYEDEVAEWVDQEDVSDYHTFTIPYGPKYHAKKIEKLLYTKDLLLNAEWNKKGDREVNLHRHPAFFGFAEDVIHDCCGFCPEPTTPEEHDVAEEEAKIYVSGKISFIKDDPGRQAIGSFHPITDDDWTEMAYVGNTARLCQAIIDQDLEHVQDWLAQEGADPNTRDYTGRTPLHLAVNSSSPAIVKALIDAGARLVARLADGRTALHLAAARGNAEMISMIMRKSEENEEEESKKEEVRKQARIAAREEKRESKEDVNGQRKNDSDGEDIEMVEDDEGDDSDVEMRSATTGSFVDLKEKEKGSDEKKNENMVLDDDEDEPDVYDVNVLSWDWKASPLHLAILGGHSAAVKELVQNFGADVLLPIKLYHSYDKSPRAAILTLVLVLDLPLEQAKEMAKTLLEIGASSAQADMNQTTAFHYIATIQPDLIETIFSIDEPAAKRALNHLAVHGSEWSPNTESPLMSAIKQGNALAALKLLEAGAQPGIEFKTWLKSVERKFEGIKNNDTKDNREKFEKQVQQPVFSAVESELPDIVLQLLFRGIDPNTITKETQEILRDDWYARYNIPQTLLDVVRKKIQDLKAWKDDEPPKEPTYNVKEGHNYLEFFEPGTYRGFIGKIQLEAAQEEDRISKESYEKRLAVYRDREGVTEKKEAIERLTSDFEKVEKHLLEAGAKTFDELYPDKVKKKEDKDDNSSFDYERRTFPWDISIYFKGHDHDDEDTQGYEELFQAAWEGNLEKIKSLTLTPWGPNGDRKPLKMAITDRDDFSPFSLAILQGHLDVAKAILEICFVQYDPETEEEKAVYRMGRRADEVDSDEEDSDEDMSDVPVDREIIDEKFTVEDIGEVSTQVKSKTSPLEYLNWSFPAWDYAKSCTPARKFVYGTENEIIDGSGSEQLIDWALITNDFQLYNFLMDTLKEWTKRLDDKEEDASTIPAFSESDFIRAIQYGRTDMLAEMIKQTGAGMELASLVKKSGVEFKERPKFYQGLSVHGSKREDWVSAARGISERPVSDTSAPLLQAAHQGSLASVEWFSSATPARLYMEFAETYKDHKLIKHLNTTAGGFEKVLHKWLDARNDLQLHCAVIAPESAEVSKLIKHLIKTLPELLELKSRSGYTPLSVAFSEMHYEAAKILIDAGADQTTRDRDGDNILHLLLGNSFHGDEAPENLQKFLDLIDKRLVASLLTERSAKGSSQTPLAWWLSHGWNKRDDILRKILDFALPTNNEHLELLDGSGETPLHWAVNRREEVLLKTMLEYRPDLLFRENSVGRTPYEVAEDAYIARCVDGTPEVITPFSPTILTEQPLEHFRNQNKQTSRRDKDDRERIWSICKEATIGSPSKRRLVSLLDANEVAKRLANRKTDRSTSEDGDNASDSGKRDEVDQWI
ncbi:ankyrin repeat protein [Aaosphaeria arxii CBS 175.79]|uniref:Ankyrin repeat protein n=1 Tax=Aaosphaeria arxii CBS 175.79 TaxID=1450172 RepID=A0A6A5Y912_9PLEO|nr:ankyrin repeat protein [Aaosphaeria arxii CBS 175.79]KAF2021723.1 ankyrin repeat protein [Aaosphaeria arxii CBS 175.79]